MFIWKSDITIPAYAPGNLLDTKTSLVGRVFANDLGHWGQSQVKSYQRLKNWYLIPPYLTLSIVRYV